MGNLLADFADFLLTKYIKKVRSAEDDRLLARVIASDASIATSVSLAQEFATAIRAHDVAAFDAWLDKTAGGGAEWRGFVESLRHDLEAVHNAVTLAWSLGPGEDFIHRLKFIKRAMYGRGGHDLLRRRVIFHLPDRISANPWWVTFQPADRAIRQKCTRAGSR